MHASPVRRGVSSAERSARAPSGAEMVEAGMRELHHIPAACHDGARGFPHEADLSVAPTLRRQLLSQPPDLTGPHGEAQLVVVPAGESELACALLSHGAH